MRILIPVFLVASLVGCATPNDPAVVAKKAELQKTIPICKADKECEIKWAAARNWVLRNADMKLQHILPDLLETYNPTESSVNIAARVTKQPNPDGTYSILVNVWCDNWIGCRKPPLDLALDFNKTVNASWTLPSK